MARQRGFPHRSLSRSRRLTTWALGPNAVNTAFSASGQALMTGISLASQEAATIVRVRGTASFLLQSAAATAHGFAGAIGFGIVTSEAFAAGIASVPSPVADADWDGWNYHQFFDVRAITATIADGVNAVSVYVRHAIDVKAMRKISSDDVYVGVIDVVEVGTATMVVNVDTRLLLKLS